MAIAGKHSEIGVIFDFDGTLWDSFKYRKLADIEVASILAEYAKKQGCKIDKKVIVSLISDIENEMSARLNYDRKAWFSEAITRYNEPTLKVANKILNKAVLSYWKNVIKNSFPYPGAADLLSSLKAKGIRLGMLSDTDGLDRMKYQRLSASGLIKFFDAVVVSGEDTKETKPDIEPFIRICNILGIAPDSCVYVGDNPLVDIAGAKQIGMKTILIRNSSADPKEAKFKADCILVRENFNELESLILNLLQIDSH